MIRGFARLVGAASLLVLAFSALGRWSAPADSFAILRPYAVLGVLAALPFVSGWVRLGLAAAAVVGVATMAAPFLPQAPVTGPLIYSKNVWYRNERLADLAADIRGSGADVVMLQEVSERTLPLLDLLRARYPHVHRCPFDGRIGNAVLSRTPFVGAGRCTDVLALAAAPVEWEGQTVWMASVHIPWPWPTRRGPEAERMAGAMLAALPGPVIAAGDFNQMPWSARARRLAHAAEGRVRSAVRPSFVLGRAVPLPIDHVISPHGAEVLSRPRLGSDHRGIVARAAWRAE